MRLQLLAEGGAAGAASGVGALSASRSSAPLPEGEASGGPEGKGAAEEGSGAGDGSTNAADGGTGAGEGGAAVDLEAEFDALVKGDGKFREVFAKRQAAATRSRNKGLQQIAAKYNALGPALDVLAARYGVAADDPALVEQIANDKSLLENLAMENGNSTEVEFQLAKARSAQQRAEDIVRQVMAEREMNTWMQQAEQMKGEYPEFDLNTEMQNPEFQKLLRNGVTMEGAYMALHFGDVKARLAARAEKKVTDTVAANSRRPRENGMGSQAGAAVTADPAKMSKEEFNDYLRRIERGEKVDFTRR